MRTLLLLAMLLIAPAALAVNDWGSFHLSAVGGTETANGCSRDNSAGSGERICFDVTSATSASFSVTAPAALACLKTDVDQEGVSATGGSPVTAIVRYCPYGDNSAAANCGVQACVPAGCTLTGLNGIPSAQLACVVLGPGSYRVDFPTAPDSPDVGLFSVEGSD